MKFVLICFLLVTALPLFADAEAVIDPMTESSLLTRVGTRCAGTEQLIVESNYSYTITFKVENRISNKECFEYGWGPQGYKCDVVVGKYYASKGNYDGQWSSERGIFHVKKQTHPTHALEYGLRFIAGASPGNLFWNATSEFYAKNQKWTENEVVVPFGYSPLCDGSGENIYKRELL